MIRGIIVSNLGRGPFTGRCHTESIRNVALVIMFRCDLVIMLCQVTEPVTNLARSDFRA